MPSRPRPTARLLALCLALVTGTAPVAAHTPKPRSAAELMDAVMWNRESIGGPFALTDQHGRRRTEADFRGKLLIVYFGYMSCADICPTDLQQVGQAIEALGAQGDEVQPLFITLDPARDTQRRLAAYVPAFHPRLVGLGGSPAAVRDAAAAYRVYFRKVPGKTAASYEVEHSSFIYLMGRDGKYLGFFPPGTPAARMEQSIRPHVGAK